MIEQRKPPSLILASNSQIRRELLTNAGLNFKICASPIDEDIVKKANAHLSPQNLVQMLAHEKAKAVSKLPEFSNDYIIGADQIMVFEGTVFDKPKDRSDARHHLKMMRGKDHHLLTAWSLFYQGVSVASYCDQATLTMRAFCDEFLEDYLSQCWEDIRWCVGCYQLEGKGIQLFEKIDGDYHTILGLSLLPLLKQLRHFKVGLGNEGLDG